MSKLSFIFTLTALFVAGSIHAQAQTDWLNNTMFASGKIKVVAAVIAAAFVLIIAYLIHIDRKVTKLEQQDKIDSP